MNVDNQGVRLLLLVEDNEGDADAVHEIISGKGREQYRVVRAKTMAEAVDIVRDREIDVILLDLRLPDCEGVESVRMLHEIAGGTPIVVLTGAQDPELALACMDAGAQDYLEKAEMRAQNLRRAIGYAITRFREAQLREMRETLERYRNLSSASQTTSVTASLSGSGAVKDRNSDAFDKVVDDYLALIRPYADQLSSQIEPSREAMEVITTRLGDLNGGPRDLLDVHLAALDRAIAGDEDSHSRSVVFEARLLALQMMGLLVEYYRVGHRRSFMEGPPS